VPLSLEAKIPPGKKALGFGTIFLKVSP